MMNFSMRLPGPCCGPPMRGPFPAQLISIACIHVMRGMKSMHDMILAEKSHECVRAGARVERDDVVRVLTIVVQVQDLAFESRYESKQIKYENGNRHEHNLCQFDFAARTRPRLLVRAIH